MGQAAWNGGHTGVRVTHVGGQAESTLRFHRRVGHWLQ